MAIDKQWPDIVAMVIADMVYRDNASGKFFVLGTYQTISVGQFPFRHPGIMVYLCFTDGRGDTALTIRLVDASESRPARRGDSSELCRSNGYL